MAQTTPDPDLSETSTSDSETEDAENLNMIHVDEADPVGELDPSFPYRDVTIKRGVDAKEFYEMMSEIGRGKFGTVYRCKEKSTGLELAAKFVSTTRRDERRNVEREVEIMRMLQHPRLIQLYDAFDNGKMMVVVLELILGGELFERVIGDDFILTEKSCTVFMKQICEGIGFVHSQNILHLDLKPENILCLTKTGNRIKIIDFGLARKFDPDKKLQVLFGTPEFVAPEVVNFDRIDFGTDMWSVGVICYVLLSGLSPFMGETDIETMANVTVAKYDFDDEAFNDISADAQDFIAKLLLKDQPKRLTATQCLEHPWLKKKPDPPPKPQVPPKPTYLVPNNNLEMTKDNLRTFVERWSEHPNSPYLFDTTAHVIVPCVENSIEMTASKQSLTGCSPSPCGSIQSSPDSVVQYDIGHAKPTEDFHYAFDQTALNKQFPNDYFQNFERRASDSSCIVNRKDSGSKVNLASEIKKLSDRLFMLATINTDLTNNNNENILNGSKNASEPSNVSDKSVATTNTEEISSSSKTVTTKSVMSSKSNGVTKINSKSNSVTSLVQPKNQSTLTTNVLKNHLPPSENEGVRVKPIPPPKPFRTGGINVTNGYCKHVDQKGEETTLPWARRTKFRVTNMNRDVPQGSPNKNSTFFGEEFPKSYHNPSKLENPAGDNEQNASNTKDCLLHLLGKWEDTHTSTTSKGIGRHQSVSMDWSESNALRQHTMSSINTFFQRQTSLNSSVEKSSTSEGTTTSVKKKTISTNSSRIQ